ncbi:MAG: hypothetical protein JO170_01955 [Verrucomicrobia bacterium]|nr:hypothetical protein [Verrucomicrobiota bacterium]
MFAPKIGWQETGAKFVSPKFRTGISRLRSVPNSLMDKYKQWITKVGTQSVNSIAERPQIRTSLGYTFDHPH